MRLTGRPPGPWLGRLLRRLRDEVAEGALPNTAGALAERDRQLGSQDGSDERNPKNGGSG